MPELPDLSEQQWSELVARLTLYAARKLARLTWFRNHRRGGIAPGGVGPEDLASQAIVDVLDDTRSYDADKNPDFLAYLRGVVDSKVSHLAASKENRGTRRLGGQGELGAPGEDGVLPAVDEDPAEMCANAELAGHVRRLVSEEFTEDQVVMGILECLEAGITKRSDIAEWAGVDVRDIDNARRRLWRRMTRLHREFET